jgi:Ca2+-binding RTX toxin-like protein
LDGGDGSDIYLVTLLTDKTAAEITDTGTTDTDTDELRFAATAAGTLTLAAGDTGLERVVIGTGTAAAAVATGVIALNVDATLAANALSIVGNAGSNTLTGSAFADTLDGGAGNDVLIGGLGNDKLNGGAGLDRLTGGLGADVFVFNVASSASSNLDTIADFNGSEDLIYLAKSIFSGLTEAVNSPLSADAFRSGAGVTTSGDTSDRIIYNTTTGAIYYDPDGTGANAAVQFAILTGLPALGADDFVLI